MTCRLAAAFVTVCLLSADVQAQTLPELSRSQRVLLDGLLTAVDRAAAGITPVTDHEWLTHVLRASDGSHYVAFSVTSAAAITDKPILVYVRLATAAPARATTTAERSVVREWLAGSRIDPRLLPRRGGVAIGEMPPMGAGAMSRRSDNAVASPDLQAIGLEHQRAREKRDADARQRRATLEGTAPGGSDVLPFEDFEIGVAATFADGTRTVQRALTAGPGTYDLYVAWVDATAASAASPAVAHRVLQLAPAMADFGLSSVVVADRIAAKSMAYSPLEQRAHPYTLGPTEIVPVRRPIFTASDQLAVAFQIVNPAPGTDGKPNVHVDLRIMRPTSVRDEMVASLSPLVYDTATLPPDFDARAGHPLIAALSAPLATIPRGDYRLVIRAEDRVSSNVASASTPFTVVGTPRSLLAEAPPLGGRFDRNVALGRSLLTSVLDRLTPPNPSAPLAGAIASAREGRFAELLVAAGPVAPPEQGVRAVLTGLALLSLGNPASPIEFERALALSTPAAPVHFLLGASRAEQGRDAEAVAAWGAARRAGFPGTVINRLEAEAWLRLKDFARAADIIGSVPPPADDVDATRTFAATRIARGRYDEAVAALDGALGRSPGEQSARWLLIHALFAQFVNGERRGRDRLSLESQRYIDANGVHSALAAEWLKVITSS